MFSILFVSAAKPVGQLAAWWNLPMVSWVATDIDFNDKNIYATMARTLGPFQ